MRGSRAMMIHIVPPLIMFAITVMFTSLLFAPTVLVRQKNQLIKFYWVGFWLFLVAIASLSGAQNTLSLAGYQSRFVAEPILQGVLAAFIGFVFFGWCRLSGKAFMTFVFRKRRQS